jgi:hypothetical protein
MNMYAVFPMFTCRPTSLLIFYRACGFLFIIFMFKRKKTMQKYIFAYKYVIFVLLVVVW